MLVRNNFKAGSWRVSPQLQLLCPVRARIHNAVIDCFSFMQGD